MAVAFPFGYSTTTLTLEQLLTRVTVINLHPEFRRRVFALMEAAAAEGVPLGIGTGWRVQPTGKVGFASPGNSNHEGFPADGVSGGAVAADMVPTASWNWMEVNCSRFGLRTFRNVNNEPWHIQPAEIPASRNWRTIPWKLDKYLLPGDVEPTPEPPAPPPPVPVPPAQGRITMQTALVGFPVLHPSASGPWVQVWQAVLNQSGAGLTVDGGYGPVSQNVCKWIQGANGLPVTGVVDLATWAVSFPK